MEVEDMALITRYSSNGCSMPGRRSFANERGFALMLALGALMLLTLIGLTLAARTGVAVELSTNQRSTERARSAAVAGLSAGRAMLRTVDWGSVLPAPRPITWEGTEASGFISPTAPTPARPDAFGMPRRDFELGECDRLGLGAGLGAVLDDGSPDGPQQLVTSLLGQDLGSVAVTLWVRRTVRVSPDGLYEDDPSSERLILTAEAIAPFVGAQSLQGVQGQGAATALAEATLSRVPTVAPCEGSGGQIGQTAGGANFGGCDPLTELGLTTGIGVLTTGTLGAANAQ
jgi:hypothetical protein